MFGAMWRWFRGGGGRPAVSTFPRVAVPGTDRSRVTAAGTDASRVAVPGADESRVTAAGVEYLP